MMGTQFCRQVLFLLLGKVEKTKWGCKGTARYRWLEHVLMGLESLVGVVKNLKFFRRQSADVHSPKPLGYW